MMHNFELTVEVIEEAGYKPAMIGLSFNKDQPFSRMPNVAKILANKDLGHNKFLEQIY